MGLLKLLILPVTGPIRGARWAVETVLDEAERQYYDEAAIRQEMLALEDLYQQGKIEEASFERAADTLLQRMLDARVYHQQAEQ